MKPLRLSTVVRNLRAWLAEATPAERAAGMDWYDDAAAQIAGAAHVHSVSFDRACAVVSVLSPMVRWERNIAEAKLVFERHKPNTGDADVAYKGHSAFKRNVYKAWRILDGDPIEQHVRGPKVESFYRTLAGLPAEPVIDSIAILAAVGIDPTPFTTSDDAAPYFNRPRALRTIQEAYRTVAREQCIEAHQAQAIVWTVYRNERDKA